MSIWLQKSFSLKPRSRGCYLVTDEVLQHIRQDLKQVDIGLAHFFLQHSSAGICLNQNADPTVRKDMEKILTKVVPQSKTYEHNYEGDDDMPAHGKCTIVGCNLTIPITKGQLNMGTWQGIWLTQFRNQQHTRQMVVTINGSKA